MFACCRRSALMVNDETPASYLPEPTPAMMESKGAVSNCAFRPSFCATRVNRSTSKPTIVLPSSAMNSAGGDVVSLPTLRTPSEAIAAGTFALRASSADTLGSAWVAALLLDELSEDPPPQPATMRVTPARAARAARRDTERVLTGRTLLLWFRPRWADAEIMLRAGTAGGAGACADADQPVGVLPVGVGSEVAPVGVGAVVVSGAEGVVRVGTALVVGPAGGVDLAVDSDCVDSDCVDSDCVVSGATDVEVADVFGAGAVVDTGAGLLVVPAGTVPGVSGLM